MKYTPSEIEMLFKKTLRKLENGIPLRRILGQPGYPSRRKFYDWVKDDESMRERYARAKDLHLEALFEEMEEIARNPMPETIEEIGTFGSKTTQKDNTARSRLLIDTIKWRLAKERPTVYGDKIDITSDNEKIGLPAIIGMSIINKAQTNDADTPSPEYEDDLF